MDIIKIKEEIIYQKKQLEDLKNDKPIEPEDIAVRESNIAFFTGVIAGLEAIVNNDNSKIRI